MLTLLLALQTAAASPALPEPRPLGLGTAYTIRSEILGENRELQVTLPESYGRTTVGYPVLFMLDGSSHVLHATATARFLANARNRIPEMIVVALPNRNRNRDMTPGPGAATFERVLAEEIIPWVERMFRAAPERIVAGHSLSASFAVHAMLNRPDLFDYYIAASAPVWRYDSLARDVREGFSRAARAGASVYLTVGEHENPNLRGGVQRLAASLDSAPDAGAPRWTFVDMKDEDHSSTPQPTLYAALQARYADWRVPFFEDSTGLTAIGGVAGLEEHYRKFSAHFGYPAPPPEARLAMAVDVLMDGGRLDDALALATRHAAAYPGRTEAFASEIGEAYCRAKDDAGARKSFREAARIAETRTPPGQRLASYREKAAKGC